MADLRLERPSDVSRFEARAGAFLRVREAENNLVLGLITGLKAGRTFVTNAPLLEFTLGGREIGDEIRLAAGGRLTARVGVRSSVPIDHLEIIGNGTVVASIPLGADRMTAHATVTVSR